MSRPGDYRGEMISTPISDQEIELLLGGEHDVGGELADLVRFVEMLRAYGDRAPSDASIHRLAVEAASIALEARPSTPANKGAPDRKSRPRLLARPQLAAVLTVLVLAWGTGVAVAADDAAPGHSLYGLDLALERVGIGAGSAGERLEEANQLLAGGETRFALEHATEALEGDNEGSDLARAALEAAIEALAAGNGQVEDTDLVVDKVAALLTYLTENVGSGVGADGREFGQGVADLARGIHGQELEDLTPDIDLPPPVDSEDDVTQPGNGHVSSNGNENANNSSNSNENANNSGNGQGNANQGNGNGGENPGEEGNGPGNGGGDNPGTDNGPGPPDDGPGSANDNGKGDGPPSESPSVTAPGRAKTSQLP